LTKTHQTEHLLVIRLNNHLAIEAAFGADAGIGAMEHLRRCAERHLGRVELRRADSDEIELLARYPLMQCLPVDALVDTLCSALGAQPFRFGDADILLSVSAGHAFAGGPVGHAQQHEAQLRLAASYLQATRATGRTPGSAAIYRRDMAEAAALLKWVRRGATFFTWRPVSQPGDGAAILYYEAVLRRVGDTGDQIDCAEAYAALERLGLAHMLDRLLVSDVLRARRLQQCAASTFGQRSILLTLVRQAALRARKRQKGEPHLVQLSSRSAEGRCCGGGAFRLGATRPRGSLWPSCCHTR
jgi:hypothetical protein